MAELHDVTDDSFDAEVLASTVPVLVDFWGDHCPACRQISPILRLERLFVFTKPSHLFLAGESRRHRYSNPGHQEKSPTVTDERKGNAGDRYHADRHSDIDEDVHEPGPEDTEDHEARKRIGFSLGDLHEPKEDERE